MEHDGVIAAIRRNAVNAALLERLPTFGLPDAWLVSGCLFQTLWNVLTGRPPDYGIRDYDIFYFDPDTSWEKEDAAIRRVLGAVSDIGIKAEPRNQARVHLWYEEKFGAPYSPLTRATDGIDRFLMPCAQIGVRPCKGSFDIYAPAGLGDLEAMIVRPNRTANFQAEHYREKAQRWKQFWPELTVLPAN